MGLRMKHVEARENGIYYVRYTVPDYALHAFPKPIVKMSLRTKDPVEAAARAAPILKDIYGKVEKARRAGKPAPAPVPDPRLIDPHAAQRAIDVWRVETLNRAYVEHYNGVRPVRELRSPEYGDWVMTPEHHALSQLRFRLREEKFSEIEDFDQRLVDVLREKGIDATVAHPVVARLRRRFAKAWCEVEYATEKFAYGDFSGWEAPKPQEAPPVAPTAHPAPVNTAGGAVARMTLSGLKDRFIASEIPEWNTKARSETEGYVRRLIEFAGDLSVTAFDTDTFNRFLVELRRFPALAKSKEHARLTFGDIVRKWGDDATVKKLAAKTIRTKWFGTYNRMFGFAVTLGLASNPVSKAIPSKKLDEADEQERVEWDPESIKSLFSAPLFQGASDGDDHGYRERPGKIIVRDHKYWLPLIGVFSGMRLGEPIAMRADEVREVDGVWCFDLTKRKLTGLRPVKNEQSKRLVPIHPTLIELGFLDYHVQQDEWLFPKIMTGNGRRAVDRYSKWFGLWRQRNGLYQPLVDFHSFRHNFTTALRAGKVGEDIQARLIGHGADDGAMKVHRGYGSITVAMLNEAMKTVSYPTMPKLAL